MQAEHLQNSDSNHAAAWLPASLHAWLPASLQQPCGGLVAVAVSRLLREHVVCRRAGRLRSLHTGATM